MYLNTFIMKNTFKLINQCNSRLVKETENNDSTASQPMGADKKMIYIYK